MEGNKRYKYLLFDLDGTLTDPYEGITKSFQYALTELGVEAPKAENLKKYIGPPLQESFSDFFDRETTNMAIAKYRERFAVKGIYENRVYEGMDELLSKVKAAGKKVALATSKLERFALQVMNEYKLAQYFDCLTGSTSDAVVCSKTDVINKVFERMNITEDMKSEVLMIGDRKYDIEGAINCGIDSIGVYFGYADTGELELAGATYVVDTVKELEQFLLEH